MNATLAGNTTYAPRTLLLVPMLVSGVRGILGVCNVDTAHFSPHCSIFNNNSGKTNKHLRHRHTHTHTHTRTQYTQIDKSIIQTHQITTYNCIHSGIIIIIKYWAMGCLKPKNGTIYTHTMHTRIRLNRMRAYSSGECSAKIPLPPPELPYENTWAGEMLLWWASDSLFIRRPTYMS